MCANLVITCLIKYASENKWEIFISWYENGNLHPEDKCYTLWKEIQNFNKYFIGSTMNLLCVIGMCDIYVTEILSGTPLSFLNGHGGDVS